ncbi:toll/interleukin-1 receptor domain-containing protein [Pseudofrankia asymbiotica]|uniref:TIR domain-containing protein n=1 Tax=Pseudofrankia asymbiotica TaxID=1834516 RepID=A0A1V2I627_9ACTN|nr:toll/interleukin-1 receptor domain-containing protein [Pseudofrankia asymbiotica]ONH26551.1 hypothetical protein BL253_24125 [Pseudofrankia asymbiotica]
MPTGPAGGPARTSVFLSFRGRDPGAYAAVVLDRELCALVGERHVFRSSRSIRAGQAFPERLADGLRRSAVTVVLIGPDWLTATSRGSGGEPALHQPDDWVRREIAESLAAGIPVIPVLLTETRAPRADQLPDDIAALASRQYLYLRNRHIGGDLRDLVAELRVVAPALFVSRLLTPPPDGGDPGGGPAPAELPPSALLRPELGVVPFRGRDAELAVLEHWLDGAAPTSALLLTGAGGQGKSRLALELCARRRALGWVAGPLAAARPGQPSFDDVARAGELGVPQLLVVDYAESDTERVGRLAEALLARRPGSVPARLLLLARAGGDWLRELSEYPDSDAVAVLFTAAAMPWHDLTLPSGGFDPDEEFLRAAAAFARRLGLRAPGTAPDVMPPGLDAGAASGGAAAGSLLSIHAAALNSVLDAEVAAATEPEPAVPPAGGEPAWPSPPSRPRPGGTRPGGQGPAGRPVGGQAADTALGRLLRHERRYWRRSLRQASLPEPFIRRLDAVVSAATLFGARTEPELHGLLAVLRPLDGAAPYAVDRYLRWVCDLYPPVPRLDDEQLVAPLRPDRVGEELVAQTLLAQRGLLAKVGRLVGWEQARRALTTLGRVLPRHPDLAADVAELLAGDPARLVVDAAMVLPRIAEPGPLAEAVEAVLARQPDPTAALQVVGVLRTDMPAWAGLHERAVSIALAAVDGDGPAELAATADLLNLRATRLLTLRGPAAAREAEPIVLAVLRIRRRLAEEAADDPGRQRDHARALARWGYCLAGGEDPDRARAPLAEALRHQRRLLAWWPTTIGGWWPAAAGPVPPALVEAGLNLLRRDLADTLTIAATGPAAQRALAQVGEVPDPGDLDLSFLDGKPDGPGLASGGLDLAPALDPARTLVESFALINESSELLAQIGDAADYVLPAELAGLLDLIRERDGVLLHALAAPEPAD